MDDTGKIVIKPQFRHALTFLPDGLAPVKSGNEWGFIDKSGKLVINPQFDGIFLAPSVKRTSFDFLNLYLHYLH